MRHAQHVLLVYKKSVTALERRTLHVQLALLVVRINIGQQTLVRAKSTEPAQLALLVIRINIGQQTLVRALQTEPSQLAQHVHQVNKKL